MDIDKIRELLSVLHPYLRWLILIMYGGFFLYINRIFINDPVLRKWVLASFEEHDGRASGKAITSFVFSKLIAFATLVAILYAPDHLLPEYFLISLLTFVGSLYGIKIASKYFNSGSGTTTETTSTSTSTSTSTQTPKKDVIDENSPLTEEEKKKKEEEEKKKNNPDDIG